MSVPSFRPEPSSTGIDPKTAGLLCYLLGFITGIIFLVIEKQSRFVKFHAIQSIAISVVILVLQMVLGWIPFLGAIILVILWPVSIILWIALMMLALQGKSYKLPFIGDWAEQQVEKF